MQNLTFTNAVVLILIHVENPKSHLQNASRVNRSAGNDLEQSQDVWPCPARPGRVIPITKEQMCGNSVCPARNTPDRRNLQIDEYLHSLSATGVEIGPTLAAVQ